jgi:hypothetical protein
MKKILGRIPIPHAIAIFLTFTFSIQLCSAQNAATYWLANGNTTGAAQTVLSLGNWSSPTSVASFTATTSDNGTSSLNLYSTRWGTSIAFTRGDPSNNQYNVMQINGNNAAGGYLSLYNTSNLTATLLNSQGASYFNGGNVLIGKTSQTNSSYLLDVNGSARANQVVVNTTGADFVFDPTYRLPSLLTVEKYIQENHHLPDIAPAAQMQDQGINLGENQTRLLQKIEELTLYLIGQNKEIGTLKLENQRLKEQNRNLQTLEERIERLERAAGASK